MWDWGLLLYSYSSRGAEVEGVGYESDSTSTRTITKQHGYICAGLRPPEPTQLPNTSLVWPRAQTDSSAGRGNEEPIGLCVLSVASLPTAPQPSDCECGHGQQLNDLLRFRGLFELHASMAERDARKENKDYKKCSDERRHG